MLSKVVLFHRRKLVIIVGRKVTTTVVYALINFQKEQTCFVLLSIIGLQMLLIVQVYLLQRTVDMMSLVLLNKQFALISLIQC